MNHLNPHTSNAASASTTEDLDGGDDRCESLPFADDPEGPEATPGTAGAQIAMVRRVLAADAAHRPGSAIAFPTARPPHPLKHHGLRHSVPKRRPAQRLTVDETTRLIGAMGVERFERLLRTKERDPR